jgi:5-hydroxyisourate hydrolase
MAQTSTISTHVLDTGLGRPARGVPVTLYRVNGAAATRIGSALTDDDGRVRALLDGALEPGAYRIEFDLAGYARAQGRDPGFFARFATDFEVRDASRSYHVPLLLSPHSGITYLGS